MLYLNHTNKKVIYGMFFPTNKFNMAFENVNNISENVQLSKGNKHFQHYGRSFLCIQILLPTK